MYFEYSLNSGLKADKASGSRGNVKQCECACVFVCEWANSEKGHDMQGVNWTQETIAFHSWNLLIYLQKTEWWISSVNVGERHFFFPSLSFQLSQSEKRGGFETLPSLLYRAAEEEGKKIKNWPSSQLLLFSCVTATFTPVWRTFISTIRPTCILRTAGCRYHVFTCRNISVTHRGDTRLKGSECSTARRKMLTKLSMWQEPRPAVLHCDSVF